MILLSGKQGDINCVWHTHNNDGVAVSSMKEGLLPISTFALDLGPISYHDFEHATAGADVCERLVKDLGNNRVLMLRNHGLITVGRSIAEAFFLMYEPL